MSDSSCPSRRLLLAYHSGRLADHALEAVKTHVGGCPACQATLHTLADAQVARATRSGGAAQDEPLQRPGGNRPAPGAKAVPRESPSPAGALPSMSQPQVASLGRLGEYKLLEKLGEGGMGTVYKALHTELERVVALKVLPKGRMEDAQAVARFKREMKAIGRLDHPNIVRRHDAREIDGTSPERVFRFEDALSEGGGVVTGVSPDGRQLALIAQKPGLWPTADVYITDLEGKPLHTLWSDLPDDHKDARALWSPDGKTIAWHHNFTAGSFAKPMYFGVGIARLGPDGKWTCRLQPNDKTFVTPLAWAPNGRLLLCADSRRPAPAGSGDLVPDGR